MMIDKMPAQWDQVLFGAIVDGNKGESWVV
jgi:hypothetical protein